MDQFEDKWEEIAKVYIPDGIREFQDYPLASLLQTTTQPSFFICWFGLLVFLIDGVLKFQTLFDYFGSYALVEVSLLLLVILPTSAVYRLTKEK